MIEGVLEGYVDETERRYKVLQFIDVEDSHIRHIVSYIYTFETLEEAMKCKAEFLVKSSMDISSGNIVYLLDKLRLPVSSRDGTPCEYQVVSVYQDKMKVGLVTSYGEYIGLHDVNHVSYVSEGPLFKKEDYDVGTVVIWADNEDVYEGTISNLHESSATIKNIKKLLSVDTKMRIPYWKIPEGRKSSKDSSLILHTIIGDDLD